MSKRSDLFYTFLHVPFDILALILAFITSYWLRGNGLAIYRLPFGEYLHLMGRSVALWIIIFALQGLYTKRYLFGTLQTMFHLAISVLAGWASFVVFLVFLKNEQTLVFPRLLLIYLLLFSFLYVFCGRIILRVVQYGLRRVGIGRSRVLLIGSGTIADSLSGALLQRNGISIDYINRLHSVDTETLARHFRQDHIDECYLADPSLGDTKTLEYLAAAYDHSVVCHLVPNMFEVQTSNVIFSTFGGLPIMTLRQTPLDGWGRIVKRLLDITLSVLGLIVLSPILVLVAV